MSKIDELIKSEIANDSEFKEIFNKEYMRLKVAVELTKLRESTGLSQREFAKVIGKKQPQISRMEKGEYNISVDTLQEYAEKTGKKLEISFT